jgi:hypothetical protein
MFVVVEGFRKTDPDVEQAEAAAQAAEKICRHDGAERRVGEQEIVVGPLGSPGEDYEKNSGDGADQNKKKDGAAM